MFASLQEESVQEGEGGKEGVRGREGGRGRDGRGKDRGRERERKRGREDRRTKTKNVYCRVSVEGRLANSIATSNKQNQTLASITKEKPLSLLLH